MEEVKTLRIAVIVDIGEDTIVTSEPLQNTHPDTVLECWSPNGVMTLFTVRAYNGCIVEYKDVITKTGRLPPIGSLLVSSTDNTDNAWFINRYLHGYYNDLIKQVMEAFGITDFNLPHC